MKNIKKFLPLIIIVILIIGVWASGVLDFLSLESIKEHRQELLNYVEENIVLSVFIFALTYIVTVALSLPIATVLTLLGGFLFGVISGAVIIVLSATIGATLIFIIAQTAIGSSLREKAGPFYNKVADNMKENGFQYMLFMRFVPVVPFFIANILPALFDIKLRDFFITTLIGIIPGTIVYANIGQELGTIETLNDLVSPTTLIAFALLGVLSLMPTAIKFLRKKKKKT